MTRFLRTFFLGAYKRTYSLALRQPKKDLPWRPSDTDRHSYIGSDVWTLRCLNVPPATGSNIVTFKHWIFFLPVNNHLHPQPPRSKKQPSFLFLFSKKTSACSPAWCYLQNSNPLIFRADPTQRHSPYTFQSRTSTSTNFSCALSMKNGPGQNQICTPLLNYKTLCIF